VVFGAVAFKLLVWCGPEGYVPGVQDAYFKAVFFYSCIFKNYYTEQCKWDPIAHFDEYVAWYIALKGLKMVESDRNMSS